MAFVIQLPLTVGFAPWSTRTYKGAEVRRFTRAEELGFNQMPTLDTKLFQRVLGAPMHPMLGARPDISHPVATLGRHAANPGFEHPHALDRLSEYIRGTADHKLVHRSGVTEGDLGWLYRR